MLDSWALLALLRHESSGPQVEPMIDSGEAVMSWINLGEVFCVEARRVGDAAAREAVRDVVRVVKVAAPDGELVMDAAQIKVGGGVSYADCFAIATARRYRASLVTGDPEIIARANEVDVIDLRDAG